MISHNLIENGGRKLFVAYALSDCGTGIYWNGYTYYVLLCCYGRIIFLTGGCDFMALMCGV